MSQRTTGLYSWTQIPRLYDLFQSVLGAHRAREILVRDYIRPSPGARILDLGCGPAVMLPYLGNVDYVGIDLNPRHIAEARRRYGERGDFRCGDTDSIAAIADGSYDIVLGIGVLHHLEDAQVANLARFAATHLAPSGRMVTIDPAFTPGQHWIARTLPAADAGRRVRTPEAYRQLATPIFRAVETTVRHDLMRIPYTHCIMTARA